MGKRKLLCLCKINIGVNWKNRIYLYIYGFSIIEYRLFCNERRGRMCINTKLENENWDATNSWSGYNYQGKIALFVVLKKWIDFYRESWWNREI